MRFCDRGTSAFLPRCSLSGWRKFRCSRTLDVESTPPIATKIDGGAGGRLSAAGSDFGQFHYSRSVIHPLRPKSTARAEDDLSRAFLRRRIRLRRRFRRPLLPPQLKHHNKGGIPYSGTFCPPERSNKLFLGCGVEGSFWTSRKKIGSQQKKLDYYVLIPSLTPPSTQISSSSPR